MVELRLRDIESVLFEEIAWAFGAAGAEDVFVVFYETLPFFLVSIIEGKYEDIAEGVGVAVEGGCEDMGDHGPTGFVLGFDVVGDACAGHLELLCSPHTVEVVIGEFLSLGDGFVDALLKGDILDLTENRCENVGEFFIEEFFVFLWRELFPDLLAEEHLGEDGGSFCEGEGAVVDGWFLALGEMSVGRVTELV